MMSALVVARGGRSLPSAAVVWTGSLVVLSIVLGGGTKPGFLSDALLQLAAVPLLIASLFSLRPTQLGASGRAALAIAALALGVALVQLVPLPAAGGWSSLARIPRLGADGILPEPDALLPASTSPRSTMLAILAGLPALAIFFATCRLSARQRRRLTLIVLAAGLASVPLGLLQVAQGPSSPLRFFAITNPTEAVGFFANRNHFAALLYVLLLFCAAWGIHAAQRMSAAPASRRFDAELLLPLLFALTVIAILVAMQTFARSRAGLGLTIVALIGVGVLSLRSRRGTGWSSTRFVLGAGLFGVLLAIQFALYRILERFEGDALADARIPFARNTIEAARVNLPFGSGLGTFVEVYGLFERPRDALLDTFANRAHNDFLEVWLESGIPGAVVFLAFAVWFVFAFIAAWRGPRERQAPIDVALARAASLVVLLLLLHSLVDYPLRTAALLAMFALACALLVPPPHGGESEAAIAAAAFEADHRIRAAMADARRVSSVASTPRETPPASFAWPEASDPTRPQPGQVPSTPRGRPWGEGIDWPAEWRKPGTPDRATDPQRNEEAGRDKSRDDT